MPAVMQFEIDRKINARLLTSTSPAQRMYDMAKTCACDTLQNGGTFVLVVTKDKITMVQRDDAVEIETEETK